MFKVLKLQYSISDSVLESNDDNTSSVFTEIGKYSAEDFEMCTTKVSQNMILVIKCTLSITKQVQQFQQMTPTMAALTRASVPCAATRPAGSTSASWPARAARVSSK